MGIKRRLLKNLKCVGKLAYVPLFFNWFLVPLLVFMAYRKSGLSSQTYGTITQFSLFFTPILSTWWLLFSFAEYVEADGNEILFLEEKVKIKDYFTILGAYLVSLLPPFAVYMHMFPHMIWDEVVLMIDCLLFSAVSYLLVFCLRSVAATFLILILYELIMVFFVGGESAFSYFYMGMASPEMILEKYLLFLPAAAMTLLGALCVNARFRHYH